MYKLVFNVSYNKIEHGLNKFLRIKTDFSILSVEICHNSLNPSSILLQFLQKRNTSENRNLVLKQKLVLKAKKPLGAFLTAS
jgi:hypothetical protein